MLKHVVKCVMVNQNEQDLVRFRKNSKRLSMISVKSSMTNASSQQNLNVVYRRQRGRVKSISLPNSIIEPQVIVCLYLL